MLEQCHNGHFPCEFPGPIAFIHSVALHSDEQNWSSQPRWYGFIYFFVILGPIWFDVIFFTQVKKIFSLESKKFVWIKL